MAATEQEMMERAEAIQTVEELREACAEFGMEMTPEQEDAFMAARASGGELPTRSWTPPSAEEESTAPTVAA